MADTSELKKGLAVKRDGKICFVQSVFFVSPGKGSAFYRTKLKEITSGKLFEKTFKSGEKLEIVPAQRRNASFLYQQGDRYIFMEADTYEQHEVTADVIGAETVRFLKAEAAVILLFIEDVLSAVDFSKTKMAFKVTDAPPAIKGDTVSNAYRAVTIETGATVQVPLFVQTGDVIIVNIETGEYSERQRN